METKKSKKPVVHVSLAVLAFIIAVPIVIQSCTGGGGGGGGGSSSAPAPSENTDKDTIIRISGYVYERESDTSYSLDLNGTLKKECTSVSIDGVTTNCEQDGYYEIQVTEPDYSPLNIVLDDYIPMQYTVWGDEDISLDLGMYPKPASVTARSGFMKGMAFLDLGNTYPPSFWAKIIAEPKERMNAELVSYVEVGFNHECDETNHTVSVAAAHPDYPDWRFSTQAELTDMVANAHAAGLQFNMWLGTVSVNECANGVIYNISSSDDDLWDDWFADYRLILLERTQVAKNLGIEWITVGHNMDYVSKLNASRWSALLTEVRALYPAVKLAYFGAAVMSETPVYFESDDYNGGTPDGFASLFDAIGVAVTSASATTNPSRDLLKTNFQTLISKTTSLSAPIWVMPMTASTTVGASDPTFIEPELLTDRIGENYTTDFYQQADVYQALFEVINGTPTGDGQVMGVLPWGYHLRNNYHDTGSESNSSPNIDNLVVDRTANVRGKPAESVLKWWFSQF